MTEHRILLDVDTGIDDALAIIYLAASAEVEFVAAGSVHGNVDARRAALNTLRVLEVCGYNDVPVALGAAQPLAQPLRVASYVHGADGLGDVDEPAPAGAPSGEQAADQIIRLGHESPDALDLVAVGPLTNLALAVQQDAQALTRFKSVTIMGGSGPQERDWGAVPMDANIDHDPEAADLVFSASDQITMVGTNLSAYIELPASGLDELQGAPHPHSALAARISEFYAGFHERWTGRRGIKLWDPLAAAVLLDPTLVDAAFDSPVDVIKTEQGFRAVGLDDRRSDGRFDARPDVRIVTAVDSGRFVASCLGALTGPLAGAG